jgi:hypothetical protein
MTLAQVAPTLPAPTIVILFMVFAVLVMDFDECQQIYESIFFMLADVTLAEQKESLSNRQPCK